MSESYSSYLSLLVETALACVAHRASLALKPEGFCPKHNDVANAATDALENLARFCRANGRDARQSPMYASFGPLASWYEQRFEFRRKVECENLTPASIYRAVDNGNILTWKGWTISCSRLQELTDSYGQFAWGRKVYAHCESGAEHEYEYPDRPVYQARLIYEHVTGMRFQDDDGLGDDVPHELERGYSESDNWP